MSCAAMSIRRPSVAYRGPNGETWTGRGYQPKWVRMLIQSGLELRDLEAGRPLSLKVRTASLHLQLRRTPVQLDLFEVRQ